MQLTIDLTGREVLVTGAEHAARQAVRRYEAAGAIVFRLSTPQGAGMDGPLPERPFLVAAVDDGQPGWEALLGRCQATGIPVAAEPPAGPAGHVTLVGGRPRTAALLTVAAVAALRDADVVFYDRLAPYQDLPSLTSAELVDVGKKPGHHKVTARPTSKNSWWKARWPATMWSASKAGTPMCSAAAARKSLPASRPGFRSASSPASPAPSRFRLPRASRSRTAESATCSPWSPGMPR